MESSLVSLRPEPVPVVQLVTVQIALLDDEVQPGTAPISFADDPPFWTWFIQNPRPALRTLQVSLELDQTSVARR